MPRGRFAADLIGQQFNRWTVIARTDRRARFHKGTARDVELVDRHGLDLNGSTLA